MRVPASWFLGAILLAACGGEGGNSDSGATPDNMIRVPTSTGAVPEAPAGPQFDPSQIEVTYEWLPSDSATGEAVSLRARYEKGEARTSHMTVSAEFRIHAGGDKEPLQVAHARSEMERRMQVLESVGEHRWRIEETEDFTLDQTNIGGSWTDTGDAEEPPTATTNVVDDLRRFAEYTPPATLGPAGQLRAHLLARVEGIFPEEEVRVGDQWRATAQLGQSMATAIHTLSALTPDPGTGDPMATIVSESTVTVVGPFTEVEVDPENPFSQTTTNRINEAVSRTQIWDVAHGFSVSYGFESQTSVDVIAVPRAAGAEGVLVPLTTHIRRQGTIERIAD